MGSTREQKNEYRRSRILEIISQPGGSTCSRMAKTFGVTRGVIMSDVRALRAKGHPIQASTMITEEGMYQAVFELMKLPEKNTHAACAE